MRFLAHLRHAYKITHLTYPHKNALNYASVPVEWDQIQNRCYGSKASGNSKFFKNRKIGRNFKRSLDKYKYGSISKRRSSKPSANITPVAVMSNADLCHKVALIPLNLFEGKRNDEEAFQEALTVLSLLKDNGNQVDMFSDVCTKLKLGDVGGGGGSTEKTSMNVPEDREMKPILTEFEEQNEASFRTVEKHKPADRETNIREDFDYQSPAVSLTTMTNITGEKVNDISFGLPTKMENELRDIPISGMQLSFEMDMTNVRDALLNPNNLPKFKVKSEKLGESKLALTTHVRVDPKDTTTIPLHFNAVINGTVDVNPQEFSGDKLTNLKVPEFNEYVTAVAANLCSTALKKGFPTDVCRRVYSTQEDYKTPKDPKMDDLLERYDKFRKKLRKREKTISTEGPLKDEAVINLFKKYDKIKADDLNAKKAISEHTRSIGLTALSVSEKGLNAAKKKTDRKSSPHIVCVKEGDKGCSSPGLADNKPYTPKTGGDVKKSKSKSSAFEQFGLLDCKLYKESLEQAECKRKEIADAAAAKCKSKSESKCGSSKTTSSSKCGSKSDSKGACKKSESASKCGSGSKKSESASKCGSGSKKSESASKCGSGSKKSESASKCGSGSKSKSDPCKKSKSDSKCGSKSASKDPCKKSESASKCGSGSKSGGDKKDPCKKSSGSSKCGSGSKDSKKPVASKCASKSGGDKSSSKSGSKCGAISKCGKSGPTASKGPKSSSSSCDPCKKPSSSKCGSKSSEDKGSCKKSSSKDSCKSSSGSKEGKDSKKSKFKCGRPALDKSKLAPNCPKKGKTDSKCGSSKKSEPKKSSSASSCGSKSKSEDPCKKSSASKCGSSKSKDTGKKASSSASKCGSKSKSEDSCKKSSSASKCGYSKSKDTGKKASSSASKCGSKSKSEDPCKKSSSASKCGSSKSKDTGKKASSSASKCGSKSKSEDPCKKSSSASKCGSSKSKDTCKKASSSASKCGSKSKAKDTCKKSSSASTCGSKSESKSKCGASATKACKKASSGGKKEDSKKKDPCKKSSSASTCGSSKSAAASKCGAVAEKAKCEAKSKCASKGKEKPPPADSIKACKRSAKAKCGGDNKDLCKSSSSKPSESKKPKLKCGRPVTGDTRPKCKAKPAGKTESASTCGSKSKSSSASSVRSKSSSKKKPTTKAGSKSAVKSSGSKSKLASKKKEMSKKSSSGSSCGSKSKTSSRSSVSSKSSKGKPKGGGGSAGSCGSKKGFHTIATLPTPFSVKLNTPSCYILVRDYSDKKGKDDKPKKHHLSETLDEYRKRTCDKYSWKDTRHRKKLKEKKKNCYPEETGEFCPDTACYRVMEKREKEIKKKRKEKKPKENEIVNVKALCTMVVKFNRRLLIPATLLCGHQVCHQSTIITNQEAVIREPYKICTGCPPLPRIVDNDVLVRVNSVALCDSDIHMFETGARNYSGISLGNEAAGIIEETGKFVANMKPGDHVVIESGLPCGKCNLCMTGHYNLCNQMTFKGCLSKYCAHPAAFCHKINKNVPTEHAALVYQLAAGCNACNCAGIRPNSNVAVIGSCTMSVCTAMCAQCMGAENVCVLCSMTDTEDIVREFVTEKVECFDCTMNEKDIVAKIVHLLGTSPDIVINCSSCTKTMNMSVMALKPAGTCVVAGFISECAAFNLMDALMKEIRIVQSFRSKNMFPLAISLLETGRVPIDCILADCCRWDNLEGAFSAALSEANVGPRRVVVQCQVGSVSDQKK